MTAPRIDFERVNAAALSCLPGLLCQWLPGGHINGPEFVAGSLQGESGRSLSVNLNTGIWRDFAGDLGGSDPVSLFAALHGLKMGEAARRLAGELGVDPGGNGACPRPQAQAKPKPADDWRPILPVPDDAPAPDFNHFRHGQPVAHWTYRDDQGRVLGYVCRFEPEQGRKEVVPFTFCQGPEGRRSWRFKSFADPRPLYALDRLAGAKPDAPVLLVEGEKTADAAARLLPGAVCMTWPGGSKAVGKADFTPLKGRRVAIWPDADKPGLDAAQAVAARLKEAGAGEVSVITPPDGVAEGWDLADAEAEGWPPERAKEHIRAGKAQAQGRAFRFLPLADLLSAPRPTKWLVRGHLEAGCLAALIGEPGSMKSFLAIDLGLCIASGTPWHGHAIPNPGPVFYLAGEGFHGLGKRVKAWITAHGADPAAVPFFVSSAPAQLLDAAHAREVADAVASLAEQHGPPRFVVVDTLNRNFGPGDENSSADMTAFVAALDTLKARFGCAVYVVHHSGLQDRGRGRGSSVLRAALDFEYILTAKDGVRVLSCSKSKDHEPPQPLAFEPEEVGTGWTDPEDLQEITSCVLRLTDMPEEDRRAELSGAKRVALDALREACEAAGGPVCSDDWKRAAYANEISSSENANARRQAFFKARKTLEAARLVQEVDGLWSPVESVTSVTNRYQVTPGTKGKALPTVTPLFRGGNMVTPPRTVTPRADGPEGKELENPFEEVSRG
ncbi:hypothetical protein NNJEOMEG_00163 [Fundidesulfovibrio magnetotacticus]|uniref:AAA family ATPase n=1 Tax=Fundidesulfovibrio magnetotacticus TaxID=2730080 RepID=A0A6V8LQD4_9BACT|nr:AAA family ATPase [Fundidesulfovibrio magnetotacticus]GFK92339.1 hypothetical protein NNJEOMEG_00163 [Fundidesulfovibrio magnetotacticus]